MRHAPLLSFVIVAAVAVACGGTTTNLGTAGNGTPPDGGGGGDADASDSLASSAPDAGTPDSGGGPRCGEGTGGDLEPILPPCAADEWCDRGAGKCHGYGTCKKRPTDPDAHCPPEAALCACDDTSYCSQDSARANGTDLAMVDGPCTGHCGQLTCDTLYNYCDRTSGGAALNESFTCKSFDEIGCRDDRSCNCVQGKASAKGDSCSWTGSMVQVEHFLP